MIFLTFLIGLNLGYFHAEIKREMSILKNKIMEPRVYPDVVSTRPETAGRVDGGSVVSPKTPYEIEWQENEEIRKLNPGS